MFNSGRWLNTYELPFYNNSYLESKEYYKWSTGGLSQLTKDSSSSTAKVIQKFTQDNLSLDFPTAPTFTMNDIGESGMSPEMLNFSFYLINKNDYWLHKNFQFLHAFFAGTQWLQLPGGMIRRNKYL